MLYIHFPTLASRSILASMIIVHLLPDTRMRADTNKIVLFIPVSIVSCGYYM